MRVGRQRMCSGMKSRDERKNSQRDDTDEIESIPFDQVQILLNQIRDERKMEKNLRAQEMDEKQ